MPPPLDIVRSAYTHKKTCSCSNSRTCMGHACSNKKMEKTLTSALERPSGTNLNRMLHRQRRHFGPWHVHRCPFLQFGPWRVHRCPLLQLQVEPRPLLQLQLHPCHQLRRCRSHRHRRHLRCHRNITLGKTHMKT